MAFNMMELMNEVSQGAKQSAQVMLSIHDLTSNPANFYSLDEIDRLKDSILMAGRVLQNITVKPKDKSGKYMIISGHRRRLACAKLVLAGYKEFEYIPAVIETEKDENLLELMLIYTNSTSRELTDAEKMRQAQRASAILNTMKDRGEFSGRVRATVAKMLKTTETQLARYAAIAGNLKNETAQKAFDEGKMGVSAAYEASRLSAEGQQQVADKLTAGENVSVQDVKDIKAAEEKAAEEKKVKLPIEDEAPEQNQNENQNKTRKKSERNQNEEEAAPGSDYDEDYETPAYQKNNPASDYARRHFAMMTVRQRLQDTMFQARQRMARASEENDLHWWSKHKAVEEYALGLIRQIREDLDALHKLD